MKRSLFFLIALTFLLQSCAKVFYTPDARYLASTHKIIAIIPPKVSIAARRKVDGAAIAMAVLVGWWAPTNEAVVSLSIHDSISDKMIWNYDQKLSSTLGSPARLVDELMRQASRKMPYFTSGS
jgi:hypothetical protein